MPIHRLCLRRCVAPKDVAAPGGPARVGPWVLPAGTAAPILRWGMKKKDKSRLIRMEAHVKKKKSQLALTFERMSTSLYLSLLGSLS